MSSVISKWVMPGIVTVVVGTAGTLFFTQETIEQDLINKSSSAAIMAGIEDGAVSYDARDGLITGISTDANAAEAALEQISALHGVRTINSDITIAPSASPYPFKAILSEGGALALSGGVPSYAMRDALLEQTGATDAGLELMSGAPEGDWLAATSFATAQLNGLESGEASLSDLAMSVSGVAKSSQDYAATTAGLMGALPNGLELANSTIQPAAVENYIFNAKRVDGETVLSGFVPSEEVRTKVGDLTGASTDGLVLASGAPEGFASSVVYGLSALGHLNNGEVNIEGADISVTGDAANNAEFTMARALLSAAPAGANVVMSEIAAPPVAMVEVATPEIVAPTVAPAPYFWSTQKRSNGTLTIRGFVPDEATRAALLGRAGGNAVDRMQIQENAPATFYEDALVSISALQDLESGRAGYTRGSWFLTGQPQTVAASAAASSALNTARTYKDDWNVTLTDAPAIVPYVLAVEKFSSDDVLVTGYVPNDITRAAIMARAGNGAIDKMVTANGAPDHFYEDALVGISSLKELDAGRTGHSASGWFLIGDPATQTASDNAQNGLNTARTMANQWYVSLSDAPPVPVVPYAWSAAKSANGIVISGNVPDESTRAAIMTRAGEGAVDQMQIGFGAPDHFYEDALVAVSAVKELETGRVGNGGGGWYLAGQPASKDAKANAEGALLTARTNVSNWNLALGDAPLIPVVPYNWSVTKASDGSLEINGNVPDDTTKAAILARAGEGAIDNMVVSYGAPDHFYEDALVAVSAASELEAGRSGLSGSGWFLFGKTTSNETRDAATGALLTARTHADNWYVAIPEHAAPVVEEAVEEASAPSVEQPEIMLDNSFVASLSEGGAIALNGMVPSNKSRIYLGQISGGVLTSDLVVSPRGAPKDFATNSRAGIRALHRLSEGRMAYEGGVWSLVGKANNTSARTGALAQIADLANRPAWEVDIKTPHIC